MISHAARHPESFARERGSRSATDGRGIWKKVRRFLNADDGPTAVEYGFMLMLVVAVCLTAVKLLGNTTEASFSNSATSINEAFTSSP